MGNGRLPLLEVDEQAVGVVGPRQKGRRRPARAVGAVAPGDASEINGVEQQRPHVHVPAAAGTGDLPGDLAFGGSGWPSDDHRLAGLVDQESEDFNKLARAQERVVRGNLHGNDNRVLRMAGRRRAHPRMPRLGPSSPKTPDPSGDKAYGGEEGSRPG